MDNDVPSGHEALAGLMAGNKRYLAGQMTHPNQSPARRQALSGGQNPLAAILGCADSRVSPTLVFDQGLGDLFVIRVAGNVVDEVVLGSLEFAAARLQVSLIMVLGHTRCGAVTATITGEPSYGHLPRIAQAIQPAVDQVKDAPGDLVENAVRANAERVAEALGCSEPILAPRVAAGQLTVVAAYYDLDSGQVEIL